jgi:hypothetical protein
MTVWTKVDQRENRKHAPWYARLRRKLRRDFAVPMVQRIRSKVRRDLATSLTSTGRPYLAYRSVTLTRCITTLATVDWHATRQQSTLASFTKKIPYVRLRRTSRRTGLIWMLLC